MRATACDSLVLCLCRVAEEAAGARQVLHLGRFFSPMDVTITATTWKQRQLHIQFQSHRSRCACRLVHRWHIHAQVKTASFSEATRWSISSSDLWWYCYKSKSAWDPVWPMMSRSAFAWSVQGDDRLHWMPAKRTGEGACLTPALGVCRSLAWVFHQHELL